MEDYVSTGVCLSTGGGVSYRLWSTRPWSFQGVCLFQSGLQLMWRGYPSQACSSGCYPRQACQDRGYPLFLPGGQATPRAVRLLRSFRRIFFCWNLILKQSPIVLHARQVELHSKLSEKQCNARASEWVPLVSAEMFVLLFSISIYDSSTLVIIMVHFNVNRHIL